MSAWKALEGTLGQSLGGGGIYGAPQNGVAVVDFSNGVVTYTPNPGFTGSDSFVVQTCEIVSVKCLGYTTTFSVTVAGASAPIVSNTSLSTPYDTPASVSLPSSGAVSGFTIASGPSHGAAAISGGSAIYTPNSGYSGPDSFSFFAAGPGGQSNTATVSVTVSPPPVPSANDGSISTAYNTSGATTLSGSGVISGYAVVAGPSHGTVSISGVTATYTPSAGYYGSDSFTFDAAGPGGTSSPATISVTVGLPPAPTVADASISTAFDTPGSTSLASTGLVSGFSISSSPSHGAATVSGSTVVYTPDNGYSGSDSFTVFASGPGGRSNTATVSVTVGPPPPPKVSNGSLSTAYNTSASITLSGTGVITSYAIVDGPGHATVSVSGSTATYSPSPGYYGSDSFSYDATGPGGTSASAIISVTVGFPPAPVATGGSIVTPYDTPVAAPLPGSGVISGYAIVSPPAHGAVVLSGSSVTYTPSAGYIGPDSFTYDVTGPGGASAPATLAVTVEPPPAPVANSGSTTCPYQTTCTITLTSTGIGSTYTLATQASNGTCSISGSTLTYVPAWGAVGSDSCTFTVTGPGGTSAPSTIYITNEPPPLPDPGGSTGAPVPTSGATTAVCSAGQSTSIPGLPGPPTGTVYDPNWCDEQALTIAQQALQLQNQQSQIAALQTQLALQQKMVQRLGSDATSPTLASVNAEAAAILSRRPGSASTRKPPARPSPQPTRAAARSRASTARS